MNIPMLLSPKVSTAYLEDDNTVRQGLEKFRVHGFTAIPVLDNNGCYLGTVSEGDFLRCMLNADVTSMKSMESLMIREIMRRDKNPPLGIDATLEDVLSRLMDTNFVPIVDGRNCYIGIVTRKSLLGYLKEKLDLPRKE